MHSAQTMRSKRPVRKQTRDQKEQCVGSEEIVGQRIRGSQRDNNANQSNNGQANADHRGRDGEDVDANVMLKVVVCCAFQMRFSFHAIVT